jgi:hypothetical protein
VKNRFQSLPFKCNLQRYNKVLKRRLAAGGRAVSGGAVGAAQVESS